MVISLVLELHVLLEKLCNGHMTANASSSNTNNSSNVSLHFLEVLFPSRSKGGSSRRGSGVVLVCNQSNKALANRTCSKFTSFYYLRKSLE